MNTMSITHLLVATIVAASAQIQYISAATPPPQSSLSSSSTTTIPTESSTDLVSSSSSSSKRNPSPPAWLTPRLAGNREKLSEYLELARQRHTKAVNQAQASYFHGNQQAKEDSNQQELEFDEYHLDKADIVLPDFNNELDKSLFVTSKSTPMFTRSECADLIRMANDHFGDGEKWTRLPSGQYDVAGFWIRDVPAVHEWFNRMLQERLFPTMMSRFPDFCNVDDTDDGAMSDLCVDNAYLFRYTPETGRRTDTHTDSGCLSFTISLNPKEEYNGGGTWFEHLDSTGGDGIIEMDVGQVTLRPGGVRHCGHAVTKGERYIIGGFCMNRKKIEYVRMLLQLAHEYSGEGNLEKAQEALEAAILLNSKYDGPFSHLADILTKRGDGALAKRALQYCLENVNPKSQDVAYSLGSIQLEESDFDGARKSLQICLDVDPMDVEAMEAMSQVYTGLQDPEQESDMYQRIISIPDVKPEILGRVYCNLGVLAQGTDDELTFFQKSLEVRSSSFPASFSLGSAYAARGEWDSAIESFRKAVDVCDDDSVDETKALKALYTSVSRKMQEETNNQTSSSAPSRDDMIRVFSDLMGASNFEKMTKLGRQ